MEQAFFFDIDGTIADVTHRLHFLQTKPKNWDAFFAAAKDDVPIAHMVRLCRLLQFSVVGQPIVFLSGRPERTREATTQWLLKHQVMYLKKPLYMRPDGDYRDDAIVKPELMEKARADGWEPIMVFDDRKRVVDAWRAMGIPCAQVAPGDF